MLKLIFGHSGSGKTKRIYELIKEGAAAGRQSYLIVPEQETVSCERKLIDILKPSECLTSEVLNFSRLANLVFRKYGGLSYNYADKACKTLIMWKSLRELAPLLSKYTNSGQKNSARAAEEMLSVIGELKSYCISPSALDKAAAELEDAPILKSKLNDISTIYAAYSLLLEKSFSDSSDDLSKLSEKLTDNDFFKGADVYVDSFTSFTRQERDVLERIIAQADSVTVALSLDAISTKHIHYTSTASTALDLKRLADRHSVKVKTEALGGSKKSSPVLRALSEHLWSHEVSAITSKDEQVDEVRIISTVDPYEEAEAVATFVRHLLMQGYRCRDIAIIARDASLYKGIIDTTLEKASIPYFFSQSSDIMSKAPVKFIVSALKIKLHNWRREDVISYLKTDLLGLDRSDVDIFDCYTSTWKIRGKAFYGEELTMNPDGFSEILTERGKTILSRVNDLKNAFVPSLVKLFAMLDSSENARDMCRAIYSFTEENGLARILQSNADKDMAEGRRKDAAESLQLYNAIIKSLENISAILGSEKLSVQEFYEAFKIMLDNTSVGAIPTAEDQVTIGSASLLRAGNIKCALVMGLCEGEFPQSIKDTGIFSDNDKKLLEKFDITLSAKSSVRSADELFYAYRAVSAPDERLFLFYHASNAAGEQTFPSMVIERVKRLFPSIHEEGYTLPPPYVKKDEPYSVLPTEFTMLCPAFAFERLRSAESPYAEAARDYFADNDGYKATLAMSDIPSVNINCELSEDTIEELFGGKLGLTQTVIDNYADCPFEYMCKRLLSLDEGSSSEFDYSHFGTYIHYIFENYLKTAIKDGVIGKEPDQEYIEHSVNRIANEYLGRFEIGDSKDDPRLSHRFARMRRLAVLVATNITREFADSSMKPAFLELSIGKNRHSSDECEEELYLDPLVIPLNDKESVSLTGKIDRVDTLHKDGKVYIRVVDYKSGAKTFSFNDLKSGKNIQLPLYLFALCDEDQTKFREAVGCKDGEVLPLGAMYMSSLIKPVEIFDSTPSDDVRKSAEDSISRSGFMLDDKDLLLEVSHSFSKQYLCGTTLTKGGKLSGKNHISVERMQELNKEMTDTVKSIAGEILGGQMSPKPIENGNELHCDKCPMKTVCRSSHKFNK